MLDPMDREHLLEALRPEAGHALDLAVGTSFTLDLEAMLFAPLAFALFEVDGPPEPTALLAAIQQNAGRIALYCDRAHIRAPAGDQKLFVLLERSLLPVFAPRGGAFHPKLWVLRFSDADGDRRHRVLVLSRNLTHDTSWDMVVRLDEDEEGQPLGPDVSTALMGLVELRESSVVRELARSVAGARFAVPRPFEDVRLRLLGHRAGERTMDPLAGVHGERLLAVSPFLAGKRLTQLREQTGRDCHLVSRRSELERLGARPLHGWQTPLVLHDAADLESADAAGDAALHGLHAKLVAIDRGERTTWFAGSMNVTDAAVERNVEVCVELSGARSAVGVGKLLSQAGSEVRFRDLLHEFSVEDEDPAAVDPEEEERKRLDLLSGQLAAMLLEVRVVPRGRGYELELRFDGDLPSLEPGDRIGARVVTRKAYATVDLSANPTACIPVARESEISGLIVVRLSGRLRVRKELVLLGRLEGEPANRIDRLLLDLVPDRRRFALLLFLMLAAGDPGTEASGVARRLIAGAEDRGDSRGLDIPLYEELVRASAREPRRLVAIDDLVERLCRTAEGRERLPEGFAKVWRAFKPLLAGARR